MSGICECGALAPDVPPKLFRQTAALVSAYMFGDEEDLLGPVRRDLD